MAVVSWVNVMHFLHCTYRHLAECIHRPTSIFLKLTHGIVEILHVEQG
jgi:hypothetical protein